MQALTAVKLPQQLLHWGQRLVRCFVLYMWPVTHIIISESYIPDVIYCQKCHTNKVRVSEVTKCRRSLKYVHAHTGMDMVKQNPIWHHHKNVSEYQEERW